MSKTKDKAELQKRGDTNGKADDAAGAAQDNAGSTGSSQDTSQQQGEQKSLESASAQQGMGGLAQANNPGIPDRDQAEVQRQPKSPIIGKRSMNVSRVSAAARAAHAAGSELVPASVPKRYGLSVEGNVLYIDAGPQMLPREWAEAKYSKDVGVEILQAGTVDHDFDPGYDVVVVEIARQIAGGAVSEDRAVADLASHYKLNEDAVRSKVHQLVQEEQARKAQP